MSGGKEVNPWGVVVSVEEVCDESGNFCWNVWTEATSPTTDSTKRFGFRCSEDKLTMTVRQVLVVASQFLYREQGGPRPKQNEEAAT